MCLMKVNLFREQGTGSYLVFMFCRFYRTIGRLSLNLAGRGEFAMTFTRIGTGRGKVVPGKLAGIGRPLGPREKI